MKAIWRQVIDITDEQTISARGLSRVLAVDSRRGKVEVWFEIDSDKEPAEITLWTIGTGNLMPEEVMRALQGPPGPPGPMGPQGNR